MDFETPNSLTRADRTAAEAVRGLTNIELGSSREFVIQSIAAEAEGSRAALLEARSLRWVLSLEKTSEFQYFARVYTDGKPLASGSVGRVLELLADAETHLHS